MDIYTPTCGVLVHIVLGKKRQYGYLRKNTYMPHFDGIITEKYVFAGDPIARIHVFIFFFKKKVAMYHDL